MDIAVIGAAGPVGRAACAQILASGLLTPDERLQLVGRDGAASELGVYGLRIDLLDAYPAGAPHVEPELDIDDVEADVILMVAGATPSHDPTRRATRDDVAVANIGMFEEIASTLARTTLGHEVVIVASNPVELAVDVFARHLGRHRVIGAGAYNDTLRLRREVAAGLAENGHRATIGGYVLGEHGPNIVPVWSSLTAHGVHDDDWRDHLDEVRGRRTLTDFPDEMGRARVGLQELVEAGKGAEAFVFVQGLPPDVRAVVKPWLAHWSGGTSIVAANAAVDIIALLHGGRRMTLPLQVAVTDDEWPGVETVLGLPVDVDITGWHRTVALHLDDDELAALVGAAAAVRSRLAAWYAAA
jgi:malate dehydrogenase